MRITAIEKQQRYNDRVNIYIDGNFAFGLSRNLVVDHGLFVGKDLSKEEIAKLEGAESLLRCLNKAYGLLSYRGRSEEELLSRLKEKYHESVAREAIEKLKEYNYLNDAEFASAWVKDRKSQKGKKLLSLELKKKGVPTVDIESALSVLSIEEEYDSALALIRSKTKYKGLSKDEAYKKVAPFLTRRGFGYETVRRVIKDLYN